MASNNSNLTDIFQSFCNGKNEMESQQFLKLCKECGIVDKKYSMSEVDIDFAKVKCSALKTINFQEFEKAIGLIAKKKQIHKQELINQIINHGPATYSGTKTDKVRLYDDLSTYSGVSGFGGPRVVDIGKGGDKVSDLSETCDRSNADIRGVKI